MENERIKEMKAEISKLNTLAATLLYASSVFQIADKHFGLGAVFFAAATCFAASARLNRKCRSKNDSKP